MQEHELNQLMRDMDREQMERAAEDEQSRLVFYDEEPGSKQASAEGNQPAEDEALQGPPTTEGWHTPVCCHGHEEEREGF